VSKSLLHVSLSQPPCCLQAIEAGLGALPITPTPEQLYAVLQYHFCPTTSPKGLLVS
jgi:hypothetical protein